MNKYTIYANHPSFNTPSTQDLKITKPLTAPSAPSDCLAKVPPFYDSYTELRYLSCGISGNTITTHLVTPTFVVSRFIYKVDCTLVYYARCRVIYSYRSQGKQCN